MLPNAAIRSVRHVATVAALSVAEALATAHQQLVRAHETLAQQLRSVAGSVTARQEQQLKRDATATLTRVKEGR